MKFRHTRTANDKTELSMTSMIDIVFLLLVFFVMTLRIRTQEGDFNVEIPCRIAASGRQHAIAPQAAT